MSHTPPRPRNLPATSAGSSLERPRTRKGTPSSYAARYPGEEAGVQLYGRLQEVIGRFGLRPFVEERIPRTFRSDKVVCTPIELELSNGLAVSRRAVFRPNTQEPAPMYDPAFYRGPEREGYHFAMMPNVFPDRNSIYGTRGKLGKIVVDEIVNPRGGNGGSLYAMSAGSTPDSIHYGRYLDVERVYLAAPTGEVVVRTFSRVGREPYEEEVPPAGNRQLVSEMDRLFSPVAPGVVPDEPRDTVPTDITADPAVYMRMPPNVFWQRT